MNRIRIIILLCVLVNNLFGQLTTSGTVRIKKRPRSESERAYSDYLFTRNRINCATGNQSFRASYGLLLGCQQYATEIGVFRRTNNCVLNEINTSAEYLRNTNAWGYKLTLLNRFYFCRDPQKILLGFSLVNYRANNEPSTDQSLGANNSAAIVNYAFRPVIGYSISLFRWGELGLQYGYNIFTEKNEMNLFPTHNLSMTWTFQLISHYKWVPKTDKKDIKYL